MERMVSLEVIKAKYNYKMINIFANIQSLLNNLVSTSIQEFNDCSLRSYLLEDLSTFNDDFAMKPLDHFVSQKTSNTLNDSDAMLTLSNDLNLNTHDKPSFTNYTRNVNLNLNLNLKTESSVNLNDSPLYNHKIENPMQLSPPKSRTSVMINERKKQSHIKNIKLLKNKKKIAK